jgi:ABC-2 type transport system permease protein
VLNEILKLRTMRSPFVLLITAQLVVAAGVSGLFLSASADIADPVTAQRAIAHAGLVSIFSLILGILAVAGEYRHKTITDTYLGTPKRGRVVAAKLAVYALAGVVFGLISSIVAVSATAIWLDAKGYSLDLGSSAIWGTLAGCVAWLALIEGNVGQLLGDLGRWLPFRSGQALENVPFPGIDLLPQWGAGVVLAAYAAIFALLAVSTTVRRDVS